MAAAASKAYSGNRTGAVSTAPAPPGPENLKRAESTRLSPPSPRLQRPESEETSDYLPGLGSAACA